MVRGKKGRMDYKNINNIGVAFGPGCPFIRLQALGARPVSISIH
jgi:hypothetical protein